LARKLPYAEAEGTAVIPLAVDDAVFELVEVLVPVEVGVPVCVGVPDTVLVTDAVVEGVGDFVGEDVGVPVEDCVGDAVWVDDSDVEKDDENDPVGVAVDVAVLLPVLVAENEIVIDGDDPTPTSRRQVPLNIGKGFTPI
jgi:hypothetical protein